MIGGALDPEVMVVRTAGVGRAQRPGPSPRDRWWERQDVGRGEVGAGPSSDCFVTTACPPRWHCGDRRSLPRDLETSERGE